MLETIRFLNLNTTSDTLNSLVNLISRGRAYKRFKIHTGRIIETPIRSLKNIQRQILEGLQNNFFFEIILPYSYGIRSHYRSAKYNALHHNSTAPWILSMDIKKFFSNTTRKKLLRGWDAAFQKRIPDEVRDNIFSLCLIPRRGEYILPTGAPTSSLFASIAALPIDIEITTIIRDIKYSRYIDDITISPQENQSYPDGLQKRVVKIVRSAGYEINHSKSKLLYLTGDQYKITGITLNSKYLIDKTTRNKLRAMIDQAARDSIPLTDPKIRGRLEWIKISPLLYTKLINYYHHRRTIWSNRNII